MCKIKVTCIRFCGWSALNFWFKETVKRHYFIVIKVFKVFAKINMWICISNFAREFSNILSAFGNYISASLVHSLSHTFCFHCIVSTVSLFRVWIFTFIPSVNLKEFHLESLSGLYQHYIHHNHMSRTAYFAAC